MDLLACCRVLGFPRGFIARDKCLSGIFMEIYMSVWMSQERKFLPKTCGDFILLFKPQLDLDYSCVWTYSCHIIPCNEIAITHLTITHFYSLCSEFVVYSAIVPKEVTFKKVSGASCTLRTLPHFVNMLCCNSTQRSYKGRKFGFHLHLYWRQCRLCESRIMDLCFTVPKIREDII